MLSSKIRVLILLVSLSFLSLLAIDFFNVDLILSGNIYQRYGWDMRQNAFWSFFYDWGPAPSLISTFICLTLLVYKKFKIDSLKIRTSFLLFPILTLITGPGILVNLIGKELWGRPRPINCIELNGDKQFQNVFNLNPSNKDKSFPSGHAASGFHLCTVALFFNKAWRYRLLILFVIWGVLVSASRILQGGHFLSDALAAAVIVAFVSILFYPSNNLQSACNKTR